MSAITLTFIIISEILNTGKFTKFKWKKSLTYPRTIRSCKFPAIPAHKSVIKNISLYQIDFKFFITYKNSNVIITTAKIIRNSRASGNKLNAAPVFLIYVNSRNLLENLYPPVMLWYNIFDKNKSDIRKNIKQTRKYKNLLNLQFIYFFLYFCKIIFRYNIYPCHYKCQTTHIYIKRPVISCGCSSYTNSSNIVFINII